MYICIWLETGEVVPVTQTKGQRKIEREGLINTSGRTEIASYEKMMKGSQRPVLAGGGDGEQGANNTMALRFLSVRCPIYGRHF